MLTCLSLLTREEINEIVRQAAEEVASRIKIISAQEVMTKKEAADYLRCDPAAIRLFMKTGLPYVMFGSHPGYYKTEIDAWMKRR